MIPIQILPVFSFFPGSHLLAPFQDVALDPIS